MSIRFTAAEMDAFASASGDRNPVHLDGCAGVAGGFEAPVVYGALAVLRALAALGPQRDVALRTLDATFHRPLFVEGDYQLTVDDREPLAPTVAISDSGLLAVTVRAFFVTGTPLPVQTASRALMRVSWIAGMRLPGPGTLITSLHVTFAAGIADGSGALTYRASVVEREPQLGEVTVSGVLTEKRAAPVAAFTFQARAPDTGSRAVGFDPRERRALEHHVPSSRALAGRVAVVVGASRGLGAALAYGLALQGCHVYACSRSPTGPAQVGARAGAVGLAQTVARRGDGQLCAIEHSRGDGSDPDFTRALLARVLAAQGGVDLLVCCAAPRLEPIGFGPGSMARFNAFVHRSIDLFTVPLATFLETVQARRGACLLVSSAALRTLPRDWGHYVAAKAAGEALAVWAAARFPDVELVVARLPGLRDAPEWSSDGTAWCRTDGGVGGVAKDEWERGGEVGVAQAAARLVGRLTERAGPGVHLVEW